MIVPVVSLQQLAGKNGSAPSSELVSQTIVALKKWSLFGTVALTDVEVANNADSAAAPNRERQALSIAELETIVQTVGGSVDLEIKLRHSNRDSATDLAIALLNAGASKLLSDPNPANSAKPASTGNEFVEVPSECLLALSDPKKPINELPAGAQIELIQPTADQLSRYEQQRVDVLVGCDYLDQHPHLIADFFQKILVSDRPDGLWSTLIVDPLGLALGLAYSNYESLLDTITHRRGTYWSRSRNELWVKGATSGATQQLLGLRIDCDRDCLRLMVTQDPPGFCHRQTHTCFGGERTIQAVVDRLRERIESSDEKSFTKKLVRDPAMLQQKLIEEADELAAATTPEHIAFEAADVLYFSLVKMLSAGVKLEQVHQELARRMTRVVRRPNKLEP